MCKVKATKAPNIVIVYKSPSYFLEVCKNEFNKLLPVYVFTNVDNKDNLFSFIKATFGVKIRTVIRH